MDILQYINKMNRLYGNEPTPVRFNTQQYLQGGRVGFKRGSDLKVIAGSTLSPTERVKRENILKEFLKQNPDFDNPGAIAKAINQQDPSLKMSRNFVLSASKRLGLNELIETRHSRLFPEIKALDKIIKNNLNLFTDAVDPEARKVKLTELFAKATNKDIPTASSQLVSRLRKLGSLYTGNVGRYEKDLYKQIKPPKNITTTLHKNFIETVTRAGPVSNAEMANMLGLPTKEINLIANTAHMTNAFDFKVAGDHTDIKAMMRDFPKYKKNFSRIEYIKDNLNQFKRSYDLKINALRKEAEFIKDPAMRQGILKRVKDLQNEFATKTGYRIGGFDISKGRVTINPQTMRLPDLTNPYNKTLQTAMKNFENTVVPGAKPEKFFGVDKELMNATTDQRAQIFKDVQGTKVAKESKYLKALQKVPKIGKIATAVIGGSAGAAAISTLAAADTGVQQAGSMFPEAAAGAGAAGLAYKYRKPIMKGVGKALALAAVPLELGFMGAEAEQGESMSEVLASPFMLQGTARENRIRNIMGDDSYQEFLQHHRSEADPVFYGEGEMTEKRLDPNLEKLRAMAVAQVQQEDDARKEATRQFNLRSDETMFKSGGKVDYDNYLPDIDDDK